MNILFYIGNSPFPYGSAGAARVRALAQGLANAGATVRVLSLAVLEDREEDHVSGGRAFHGVPYESVTGYGRSARRLPLLIGKLLNYSHMLSSSLRGYSRVKQLTSSQDVDAIILYGWNCIEVEPVIRLARSRGITTLCDVVEWPTVKSFRGGMINPLYWLTRRTWQASHFLSDGIIAISSFIEGQYVSKGRPAIRIPAVTDLQPPCRPARQATEKQSQPAIRLAYLGKLAGKDDPETMLAAIKLAIEKGTSVHLDLLGTNGRAGAKYQSICSADPLLASAVSFHGWVPDEHLPAYLQRADALILLRRADDETRASFPTRLPELLLNCLPVITSAVGSISEYLVDQKSVILAPAGDAPRLADRILDLACHPERAARIGKAGFQVCLEHFRAEKYALQLIKFLESLSDTPQDRRMDAK
ncbi:MAG: glycosyltransferase family 4 protein [Anaerolineales bacterium]